MKKSELRTLIREQIKKVLKEATEPRIYFTDKDKELGTAKGSAAQSDWLAVINKVMGDKSYKNYLNPDEFAAEAQKEPGGKEGHTMGIEVILRNNNPELKKLLKFVQDATPGSSLNLDGDDGYVIFSVK